MVSFFRKKTDADTAKRKPNGAANDDDGDGDNGTYPPPGKFQGPMTINGEGTMDAGETDGTADIPEEYRDANGNFKIMPVPRHLGSLTRRRPPLAVIVGVSGAGKSRLAAALMGKEKAYRAEFRVGRKTTIPKVVLGEKVAVLDTPGLPDPIPGSSAEYYDATVEKLRHVGYVNAVIFVLNQERVTPTLIKNYGILYSSLNRLPCVKMFVCRREHSFVFRNIADQALEEQETRQVVNSILEAAHLKSWTTKRFFMWTNGSGEEQDKQVKYIREQVKSSPRVDITPGEGLLLTTERAMQKAQDEAETKETAGSRSSWRKAKKADTAAVVAAIQPGEGAKVPPGEGAKVPPWEGAAAVAPSGEEAVPTAAASASAKNSGCVVM